MLIIQRTEHETLWIGETEVRVLRISGKRVKLGIIGPGAVQIVRGELDRRDADSGLTLPPKRG